MKATMQSYLLIYELHGGFFLVCPWEKRECDMTQRLFPRVRLLATEHQRTLQTSLFRLYMHERLVFSQEDVKSLVGWPVFSQEDVKVWLVMPTTFQLHIPYK
jgi:hypothetical protein